MQLSDGRTVGYAEYGSDTGDVLVDCHGFPGSRLEAAPLAATAMQAGVRVLSLDRPGFGHSTFQKHRTFLDWPADLVEVVDRLGIARFSILGVSGGAPYALACAKMIPHRLISCGVVSGMGPLELGTAGMSRSNRIAFWMTRRTPWALRFLYGSMARSLRDEKRASATMKKQVQNIPKPDREALLANDLLATMIASTAEAFRQGTSGAVYEGRLYGSDWGFRLEDIEFKPIYLWHGALDVNVPIGMARAVAERIPGCTAVFYPDEAHLSTPLNHEKEILSALLR